MALGTDGASSNNDLDMIGEMRSASLLCKGVSGDPTALNAEQALRAATLNGAKSLGLDHRTGSIEPGKAADLCAIDLSAAATSPVYHPVAQAVYSASRDQVSDVWVNGQQVLLHGEIQTVDEDRALADAANWGERIGAARDA